MVTSLWKGEFHTKEQKDYQKIIADKILEICDAANLSIERLAEMVRIPKERLKEITECRGEKMSIDELYKFRDELLISPDYMVGRQNFIFDFEPTEENIHAFTFGILERLKQLEGEQY